jgi:hypothetical protein
MALIGTPEFIGDNLYRFVGIAGANDNDIVIETEDLSRYDTFELSSLAGAMDVFVSHDGGAFPGPRSLGDLGATTLDPVIVTAAGRAYGFRGVVDRVRIRQNGATPVAGAVLVCKRIAR